MANRLNWGPWIYGLFAGFIGGGAGAVANGFANAFLDPQVFNTAHPSKLFEAVGLFFLINGFLAVAFYLKQSPLPSLQVTTTTEVVSVQKNPPALMVKTVETKESNS